MTSQEYKLWVCLRKKKTGVKWRRQHGIGPYIVDFYCKDKSMVIELDGSQHIDAKEYDKERDSYLHSLGIKVQRFWNNDVDSNLEEVLLKIRSEINHPSVSQS